MSTVAGHTVYSSVSTSARDENNSDTSSYQRQRFRSSQFYPKRSKEYDYKPIPLRLPFLITFILIFAACITCLELLLHHTETVATTSVPSISSPTIPTNDFRRLRRTPAATTLLSKRETIDCTEKDRIPSLIDFYSQLDTINCDWWEQDFAKNTKNLTFAVQTELQQWLKQHSDIQSTRNALTKTSRLCAGQKGYYDGTLRVGCSTTVYPGESTCPPKASLWIMNFALSTTIADFRCSIAEGDVLVLTSRSTTTSKGTGNSAVPSVGLDGVLNTATAGNARTSAGTDLAPATLAPGQAATSLPTITKSMSTVPTGAVLYTATPSDSPAPASPNPERESSLPTVTKSNAAGQSTAGNNVAPSANTNALETSVESAIAVFGVLSGPASAPQVVTVVTNTNAVAVTAVVYTVGTGQVASVATTTQAAVAAIATYTTINANGQVQTSMITQSIIQGTTSLVTTTRGNGIVETMAVVIGTPMPVPVTRVSIDATGQAHTIVSVGDAAPVPSTILSTDTSGQIRTVLVTQAMSATTYVSTDSSGQVFTVVSALPQSVKPGAAVTSLTTYLSTNSAGKVSTITSVVTKPGSFYTYVSTNSNGEKITMLLSTTSSGYRTVTQYTSMVTTTGTDGRPTSFMAVVEETVTLSSSPTSQRTSTASEPTAAAADSSFVLPASHKIVEGTFNIGRYITALYIPALIAILIRVLWEIVFAAIKLIEPFERMAHTTGIDAHYSVLAQYLSSTFTIDTFKSLSHGNLVPLWSAVLFLIVHAGPPLAAVSMTVDSRSMCLIDGENRRCDPVWLLNVPMIRALEVIMALGLATMALVVWSSQRYPSGIPSDASSISALAQLINDRELVDEVRRLPLDTDHSHYVKLLDQYRFCLSHHVDGAGKSHYGILGQKTFKKLDSDDADIDTAYNRDLLRNGKGYKYEAVHDTMNHRSSFNTTAANSRVHRNRVGDFLGLLFPVAILALVLTHYFDDNLNDAYNKFMNSRSLAPKLLLVALGSCSSMHLSHLERSIRITEPFRRLAMNSLQSGRRPAPAETTVLISRSGTAYSNALQCVSLCLRYEFHGGRMIFQTLISFTVILSDAMIIAVAGVPLNRAMTMTSYRLSCYFSIGISIWIIIVYLAIIFWWRRNEAVCVVAGQSISKSVGTIGGLMRWLISGGPEVLEVIAGASGEGSERSSWKRRISGTRIWFGKNRFGEWTFGAEGVPSDMPTTAEVLTQTQNFPVPVEQEPLHVVEERPEEFLIPVEPEQTRMVSSERRRWRSDSFYDPPIPVVRR